MVDSGEGWIPLEGNPEVLDAFAQRLGVSQDWAFSDVYSLDAELVAMVPKPVSAVLMVYPITDKSEIRKEDINLYKIIDRQIYILV